MRPGNILEVVDPKSHTHPRPFPSSSSSISEHSWNFKKNRKKELYYWILLNSLLEWTETGVNYTKILQAAFKRADPKSAKKTVKKQLFVLSGSAGIKAAGVNTLMKLTPAFSQQDCQMANIVSIKWGLHRRLGMSKPLSSL